jgi:glycosyltransferase involved in cell wall biosynthesis
MLPDPDLTGRHVVCFSWRDTTNPEGGGAELYLERVAAGLVAQGARVTIYCAEHGLAPRDEERDGIRFVRRGSKMGIYARGLLLLLTRRFGRVDAVVDVQNGLPFFTRLGTRAPVIVLVHHVHREQWPVVYPGLVGRIGWFIERRVAPRLYRGCQYVAVSTATRDELVEQGVVPDYLAVVHNGTDPAPELAVPKTAHPSLCVVGRLVPHKQVEHAIDAWEELRDTWSDLTLTIVGSGWWEHELTDHADRALARQGLDRDSGAIVFEGHVSEERKNEVYASAWVMALPSLKEGWGLVVGEAGMHDTPTVAYAAAGGTRESIAHDVSGLLAHDQPDFTASLRRVLADEELRARLSRGAREMSHRFTWGRAQHSFGTVVSEVLERHHLAGQDPV